MLPASRVLPECPVRRVSTPDLFAVRQLDNALRRHQHASPPRAARAPSGPAPARLRGPAILVLVDRRATRGSGDGCPEPVFSGPPSSSFLAANPRGAARRTVTEVPTALARRRAPRERRIVRVRGARNQTPATALAGAEPGGGREVPCNRDRRPARGHARRRVWLRDVLGALDDQHGFGQDAVIRRRLPRPSIGYAGRASPREERVSLSYLPMVYRQSTGCCR